ncbi:MAG: alpha/beta hydrolase [bacterium]|tara:strand:+ start:122 stop:1276 length:1155 start_codon:yes stop_codon:yes gene_type:complete
MKILLKVSIVFIALSFFYFFKPVNKSSQNFLSLSEAEKIEKNIYNDFKKEIIVTRSGEMEDRVIELKDKKIKFDIKHFGEQGEDGWSLFISLHGGGGTTESENNRLWNRHKTLYELEDGILFTPRSPSNTWNMWFQSHVDTFFNRIIQNMIAFHNVDPNKIYIMGRSAGGDGIYQVAPRMADRFAAAAMSAGHPNDSSPLGLRNTAFTIHMGENDSLYNRNDMAVKWGNDLKKLNEEDPEGYRYYIKIYKNKGHWMDNLEASALDWMSDFIRNPYPSKVVWKQGNVLHKRFYWLRNEDPSFGDLIECNIDDQIITVLSSSSSKITIQLNDDLVDMDREITVNYLGRQLFKGFVYRDIDIIKRSIREYGDPKSVYYGEIRLTLDS